MAKKSRGVGDTGEVDGAAKWGLVSHLISCRKLRGALGWFFTGKGRDLTYVYKISSRAAGWKVGGRKQLGAGSVRRGGKGRWLGPSWGDGDGRNGWV